MRIQTAISQMTKVAKYIQECADSNTNFYESTRDGFNTLISLIDSIQDNIQRILSADSMICTSVSETSSNPVTDEAPTSALSNLEAKVDMLFSTFMDRMDTLDGRISNLDDRISKIEDSQSSYEAIELNANIPISINARSVRGKSNANVKPDIIDGTVVDSGGSINDSLLDPCKRSAVGRNVVGEYANMLRKLSSVDHGSKHINNLCKLLWVWFDYRFLRIKEFHSRFRYTVFRIQRLIYAIVISYGYHIEQNDTDKFLSDFYKWIDEIGVKDDVTNKYATPYDVYMVEKQWDSGKVFANSTSILLYSVLWGLGLGSLAELDTECRGYYPSECGIDDLLQKLDGYPDDAEDLDYRDNPGLLYTYRILSDREVLN